MTQTLTRVAEGAVSNAEATLKRGPPTLDEQAGVLGAYLVMAGAINPNTKRPYGLDESRGVDILSIDGNQEGTTRDIGMGALAVAFLFGAPHELPDGVAPVEVNLNIGPDGKDKALVVDIATLVHNVQLIATEWGVDQALEKLSQSNSPLKPFNGKAIKQRVDEFIEKYQEFAGQYTTEELSKMLDELHGIVGKRASRVSGRIIPKILNRQRQKIPYEATADTLLHLKETGKAQCVVFSTIAAVILERLGLDPRYVSTPGHIYIQVNGLPYDGAASMNPRFLESGDQVSRVSSIVNAYIHNNYAILLKDIGRLEEAESHYLESLRLDPDSSRAHSNYANLLKDIGRLEEAESHHLEALRLNPDGSSAHNNYAILLCVKGDIDGALKYFRSAGRKNISKSDIRNYVLMQIPIINQRIEEFNQRLDANDPKRRPLLTVPEV